MESIALVDKKSSIKSYGISVKTDPFKRNNNYIPIVTNFNINDDDNEKVIISSSISNATVWIDSNNNDSNNAIVKFTQRYQPYILTVSSSYYTIIL